MRLEVADRPRVDLRRGQRPPDRAGLRVRVRHRVPVRLPAVRQRAPPNHAVNVVPVPLRLPEAFQDDHPHPFARDIPVAPRPKALAVAGTRDELSDAEHQILMGMNADIHTAGNRKTGPSSLQILTGHMNRR